MELLPEVLVNNVYQIMASYNVRNPNLAAQAATSAPLDFTAISTALAPHFTDDTLRNAAAAAVYQERQAQLLAGTMPMVQPLPQAHLPIGQAMLPVQLPAAPGLAWMLPGMVPPTFPQAQPQPHVQQPVVVQQFHRGWLIAIVVISSVALLFLLTFGILWMKNGSTQQHTIDAASATATVVKVETDKLNTKADDLKVTTDAINAKANALKVTTDATGAKADALKVVTDNLTVKVDDAKLTADAMNLKVDALKVTTDAANTKADALKTDLANARASLRRAIATRASAADVAAAEGRMLKALAATKITVRVEK
jgi:hypothetical protein